MEFNHQLWRPKQMRLVFFVDECIHKLAVSSHLQRWTVSSKKPWSWNKCSEKKMNCRPKKSLRNLRQSRWQRLSVKKPQMMLHRSSILWRNSIRKRPTAIFSWRVQFTSFNVEPQVMSTKKTLELLQHPTECITEVPLTDLKVAATLKTIQTKSKSEKAFQNFLITPHVAKTFLFKPSI